MRKNNKIFLLLAICLMIFTSCQKNENDVNEGNDISNNQQQDQITKPEENKSTSFYYTANESGSISIIDSQSNEVIKTLSADGMTHNVQVSPDGKILGATVAAHMDEGQTEHGDMNEGQTEHGDMSEGQTEHGDMNMNGRVLFYDTETNELIKEVEVGNHPAHIVFTPDGKLALVTNNEDNNLYVIDMGKYEVTNQVDTGKGPHGLRISADGKYAYIANMGENTVSILDLSSFTEKDRIEVGNTPVTTGITSDGKTMVATVNGEDSLAIVNLENGNIDKVLVGKGPAQVYIQHDDKYAFVANQGTEESPSNTVSKINLVTKTVEATIDVGKGAHGVVTSDDNKYVYVTNMYEATVSVIDNKTNKVIATVPVDKEPNGINYK